ncbi:MAG TPA: hypothetical protein VNY05_21140, partial [Candidatus Acidoferrales bacterium]|nr:hypothetical protein [Candidatus Acidoferrales bacterium]
MSRLGLDHRSLTVTAPHAYTHAFAHAFTHAFRAATVRERWLLACVALLPCVAAHAQTVNFSEHIAPIIYNNCSTCHRPGQVSPFSLLSYADVQQHGQTIAT